jgi:beta-glucosidase
VAGVMPTYTVPRDLVLDGRSIEPVAGGFSRELLADLLRARHGFDGFVLSDWAIYLNATERTLAPTQPQSPNDIGMPWGVESLSRAQRFAKSIDAGVDQLGGEEDVATLIRTVEAGLVSRARVDEAVFRLLLVKFRQGLFEDPLVDEREAVARVGAVPAVQAGRDAQRRSLVCLKKPSSLTLDAKLHLVHFERQGASLDVADAALIRLTTPHEVLHPNHFFGSRQQEGDIDFKPGSPALAEIESLAARVPTTAVIQMSRPAIVANLLPMLDGLYVDFGVAEDLLIETLIDAGETSATLPFELPSSMAAVSRQRADMPCDSEDPTFRCGSDYRTR